MRWIPFILLLYAVLLVQTTLGRVLVFSTDSLGPVGPDLLAIMAVFVALRVRSGVDAALAGWILGFALDLTVAAGTGSTTVLGPMALSYALGSWGVYRIREALFRDRMTVQALLVFVFCCVVHFLWVTAESLFAGGPMNWACYGRLLLQAAALAAYTAVLAPLGLRGLGAIRGWIVHAPAGRNRRGRR